MKIFYCSVIGSLFLLSGCSSLQTNITSPKAIQNVSQNRASFDLTQVSSCCSSLDKIQYQPFPTDSEKTIVINQQSQAFSFPEGKSYFAAYILPTQHGSFRISLTSLFTQSVFVPQVMLLDEQFHVTRVLDEHTFRFKNAVLLRDNQYSGSFTVTRQYPLAQHYEKYMLIYTPAETLQSSTAIETDEMKYAKAHALVTPVNSSIQIPHSPAGNIHLEIDYEETPLTATTAKTEGTSQQEAVQETARPAAMLKQTEKYYNDQIMLALKAKNYQQAVALYQEAKRLGSPTAEQTFLKGIQ